MRFFYRIFVKGLIALLPILITIYLIAWIAQIAESAFADPLMSFLPEALYFPGMGVVLGILLVVLIGFLVDNYLTAQFFDWIEEQLLRIPLFKAVYGPIRDVMGLFTNQEQERKSQRVVLVTLPGLQASALGLVTRDRFEDFAPGALPPDHIAVFLPYSYAVGGFTLIVPKANVREVGISAERAMQLAITAWIKADKNKNSSTNSTKI